jgi:hypothetical protein
MFSALSFMKILQIIQYSLKIEPISATPGKRWQRAELRLRLHYEKHGSSFFHNAAHTSAWRQEGRNRSTGQDYCGAKFCALAEQRKTA